MRTVKINDEEREIACTAFSTFIYDDEFHEDLMSAIVALNHAITLAQDGEVPPVPLLTMYRLLYTFEKSAHVKPAREKFTDWLQRIPDLSLDFDEGEEGSWAIGVIREMQDSFRPRAARANMGA